MLTSSWRCNLGFSLLLSRYKNLEKHNAWDMVPTSNTISVIGDSISTHMVGATLRTFYSAVGGYMGYAHILPKTGDTVSDGKMRVATSFAVGGAAIGDILANQLPSVLALSHRPGFCVVLGGTNDLPSLTTQAAIDARIANLQTIYNQLIGAHILPIACAVPTNGQYAGASRLKAISLNSEIETLATSLSIPFVDFFSVTDNGVDGWIAGMSTDTVHPITPGAVAMGQLLKDTLYPYLIESYPQLVTEATQGNAEFLLTNSCFTADSNADGIPDGGWIVQGASELTCSLVDGGSETEGNWWRLQKTAYTAQSRVDTGFLLLTPGQRIGFGFKLKVVSADQTAAITMETYSGATALMRVLLTDLISPVAVWSFWHEHTVPAGQTACKLAVIFNSGNADVYVGQYTARVL